MSDDSSRFSRLIRELRRRRVYRTAALYIIGAWVVIEAAELTFSTFRFPDWSLRGLFVAALLGFPVALIFGWMFEITDRGIVRTARETHTDPEDLDLRLRSKDYVILAALVVVLMAITGGVFINVPQQVEDTAVTTPIENIAANLAQAPKNSIAVLPFVNMSDDKANEYFSDGMTEEILDDLAKLESLHVAARTSSFFFKDKQYTIDQVGDLLGVRYALEGSVRKSGVRARRGVSCCRRTPAETSKGRTFHNASARITALEEQHVVHRAREPKAFYEVASAVTTTAGSSLVTIEMLGLGSK